MSKYMIHTMPKRLWYVEDYLIPSMLKQGIQKDQIRVYCDPGIGCLKSCMEAFKSVGNNYEGTWHMQDDVIICHNFKEQTENWDWNDGIVCGFCCKYDNPEDTGIVPVQKMWWSFPCIRIPNNIAYGCATWYYTYMEGNDVYTDFLKDGVNDDWIFRHYVWDHYKDMTAINLVPNLVDHIDYLIGGTVNSSKRTVQIRSKYWKDEYLVNQLEEELCHNT